MMHGLELGTGATPSSGLGSMSNRVRLENGVIQDEEAERLNVGKDAQRGGGQRILMGYSLIPY